MNAEPVHQPTDEDDLPRRFLTEADLPRVQTGPGVRPPAVLGRHFTAVVLHPRPETQVPDHAHPEEVLGIVVEGYLDLVIGGVPGRVEAPGYYHVPPGVVHSAHGGLGHVIEVFAPARGDLVGTEPDD